MKSNIKKLAVNLMIAAMAMFIVAAMASAEDRDDHSRAIRGQYASTGGGTCVEAIFGFGIDPCPSPSSDCRYIPSAWENRMWVLMTYTSEGVWTFKLNGTGTVARTSSFVFFSPLGSPTAPWPSGAVANDTWEFTYVIGHDGQITLTEAPGWYVTTWKSGLLVDTPFSPLYAHGQNRRGTIAMDGKTIVLNGGLPDVIAVKDAPSQLICNDSAVLVRIKE